MRKLTQAEKRLSLVFGGVILIVAHLFLARLFLSEIQALQREVQISRETLHEYHDFLAERPYWEARMQWMEERKLQFYSSGESDSAFAEKIQESLMRAGLSIESQQLRESEIRGKLAVAGLDLTVKGRMEQIVRWLKSIQEPGNHTVIQEFDLKRVDEGETMIAKLRLNALYRIAR